MPAASRRILVVDDDAALRASPAEHFSLHSEFDADQAASAAEAKLAVSGARHRRAARHRPAGRRRPGALRAAARARPLKVPIVLLAGAGAGAAEAEREVVGGLDAGANDVVAKPVRAGELLARVRAQLRAFDASEDARSTARVRNHAPALPVTPFRRVRRDRVAAGPWCPLPVASAA